MGDARTTVVGTAAVTEGADADVGRVGTLAIYNYPAERMDASLGAMMTLSEGRATMEVAMVGVMAIVRGRVEDPRVRAWTYTLDGHDYYVLHLGDEETVVYDTHSQEWFTWGSGDSDRWRANDGTNWHGSLAAASEGAQVVAGDDSNGSLYLLSPEKGVDDTPNGGTEYVQHIFHGQLVKRRYDYESVHAVEILGSIGQFSLAGPTVELLFSDDRGNTYVSAGTVTLAPDELSTRLTWQSLGAFTAPGRMFRFVSNGAVRRVDSVTADTDGEQQ